MSSPNHESVHLGSEYWDLKDGYNPELLLQQLDWLLDEPSRRESAISHMQPILGFNALVVALDQDSGTGKVNSSIQLNFYDNIGLQEENRDEGKTEKPHSHSKDAVATWYAQEGSRQVVTRINVLPSDETPPPGIESEERLVVANCVQGVGEGRRPEYRPILLGETATNILSRSWVTNGGQTSFSSTEVHTIATEFSGLNQIAISVHFKSHVEAEAYNNREGLMKYKKLTKEQADRILETRRNLTGYLGPITMMYPRRQSFDIEELTRYPRNTDKETSVRLLEGGRDMVARLCS